MAMEFLINILKFFFIAYLIKCVIKIIIALVKSGRDYYYRSLLFWFRPRKNKKGQPRDDSEIWFNPVSTTERIGQYGESIIKQKLTSLNNNGISGKILQNLYIPVGNGNTSEVDLVFITKKGIFVIESKYFSGWIFGNDKDQFWMSMLSRKEKNRFYNPVLQNATHIKRLKYYLKQKNLETPFFSIIVFSDHCELKKITVSSIDVAVIQARKLYGLIESVWNASPDLLSSDEVDAIYNSILPLTQVDKMVKERHVQQLNELFDCTPKTTSLAQNAEASSSEVNENY